MRVFPSRGAASPNEEHANYNLGKVLQCRHKKLTSASLSSISESCSGLSVMVIPSCCYRMGSLRREHLLRDALQADESIILVMTPTGSVRDS